MEFAFIDASQGPKHTKAQALRHVMKGKNAGKTHLCRRTRPRTAPAVKPARQKKKPDRRSPSECSSSDFIHPPRRKPSTQRPEVIPRGPARSGNLETPFPGEEITRPGEYVMNQFFTFVMDTLYPPQLCLVQDDFKAYWYQLLLLNETSYHTTWALMATMNEFFFGRDSPTKDMVASKLALYHMGRAVGLVNQSLDGSPEVALSVPNLAVVNFMIVRDVLREDLPSAEVHVRGLYRMIELLGGLSRLGDEWLLLKICKTDIDYALHRGTPVLFYRDHMADVAEALASQGHVVDRRQDRLVAPLSTMSPFLRQIFIDATEVASVLNRSGDRTLKIDPSMFLELLVSLGCRTIMFRNLNQSVLGEGVVLTPLESSCHIGVVVLICTLFIQFGRRRFLRFELVARCLRRALREGVGDEQVEGVQDLRLWLLTLGGISVLPEEDMAWVRQDICDLLGRPSSLSADPVPDWANVRERLARFPWIGRLHDEAGEDLWRSSLSSSVQEIVNW